MSERKIDVVWTPGANLVIRVNERVRVSLYGTTRQMENMALLLEAYLKGSVHR